MALMSRLLLQKRGILLCVLGSLVFIALLAELVKTAPRSQLPVLSPLRPFPGAPPRSGTFRYEAPNTLASDHNSDPPPANWSLIACYKNLFQQRAVNE